MIFSSFISSNYYYIPMEDFDIIMIYQTITVSVCSPLLHDKIAWLRFENESDKLYYSMLYSELLKTGSLYNVIQGIWLA